MKKLLWVLPLLPLLGCSAEPEPPGAERLGAAVGCTPVGEACSVVSGDRSVTLRLPSDIRPLSRFPVVVGLEGIEAREVTVEFTMQGMDMGVNRFGLRRTGDRWSGEAILPVCTTGRVDWIATVEAAGAEGRLAAEFAFETGR